MDIGANILFRLDQSLLESGSAAAYRTHDLLSELNEYVASTQKMRPYVFFCILLISRFTSTHQFNNARAPNTFDALQSILIPAIKHFPKDSALETEHASILALLSVLNSQLHTSSSKYLLSTDSSMNR